MKRVAPCTLASITHGRLRVRTQDLDVDMGHVVAAHFRDAVHMFISSSARRQFMLSVDKDWAAPVNTGVMLFRTSRTHYERALAMVETGVFDGRLRNGSGFNRTGRPRELMSAAAVARYRQTTMVHHNTWAFVGGDSDQGLYSWYAINAGAHRLKQIRVDHFWGQHKPFHCARWVADIGPLPPLSACGAIVAQWNRTAVRVCKKQKQYI